MSKIKREVASAIASLHKVAGPPDKKIALNSGSTLVNLAFTGTPNAAYLPGKYYLLVGDSSAGKTFLAMTALAEACQSKLFENHELYLDNVEDGALMDVEHFFGKKLAERLRPPRYEKGIPVYSSTVEDFYDNLSRAHARAVNTGKPYVYILDSENALSSEAEQKKHEAQRKARVKDVEAAGSYGDAKAAYHSQHLRIARINLRDTASILIILSQTRDNLGFGFEKKTRSGGRALKFYASVEAWLSVEKVLKKTVRGKPREIGIMTKLQVRKNRTTGRLRVVSVPILHSAGVDDLGSCIDYLVEESYWKAIKKTIKAPDFEFEGSRSGLIELIEKSNRERELRALVTDVWREIEEACEASRKPRYR
jgi:RecA/RadA recombinase